MKRLCIICEGQTEREFVRKLLASHLQTFGIDTYATPLTAGPRQQRGGNVSVPRLGKHISREYHKSDFITTLVDYYGFKNANGRPKAQLEQNILSKKLKPILGSVFRLIVCVPTCRCTSLKHCCFRIFPSLSC